MLEPCIPEGTGMVDVEGLLLASPSQRWVFKRLPWEFYVLGKT